jgi:hypothetical protein
MRPTEVVFASQPSTGPTSFTATGVCLRVLNLAWLPSPMPQNSMLTGAAYAAHGVDRTARAALGGRLRGAWNGIGQDSP